MKLTECISSAFSNVYSHKMRSILTMLGIIIGISSVIMITSVGNGVKNAIFDLVNSFNRQVIQVYARSGSMEDQLTFGDAKAIASISNVQRITCLSQWYNMKLKLRVPGTVKDGALLGTDQNLGIIEEYNVLKGRFISANDVENRSRIAVIKKGAAVEVFGRVDCIGEKIEVETYYGTEEFTVIGILSEDDENGLSGMVSTLLTNSIAIIPITTMNDIFYYEEYVDFFGVTVKNGFKSTETSKDITDLLTVRHGVSDVYQAESLEGQFDMIDSVLNAVTTFIAFVAAISLFVGGVGVMNIMLVTVKERTREIGIRKSLGATRGAIKVQFIFEAVILSLLGGIIGLIAGGAGAHGIGWIISSLLSTKIMPVISGGSVIIAVGISSLVGIVFGVYPAGKAAKLNPVEALRYE